MQAQIAQQVASASPGADVSVQYQYTAGPDGQLIVSGATVTITQEDNSPLAQSITGQASRNASSAFADRVNSIQDIVDIGSEQSAEGEFGLSSAERAVLRELQASDVAVRRHEGLHFRAAAGLGSSPDYTLVQGPDGQFYAVGGSVSVSSTSGADPQKAAREAETLQLAATAPGDASAQDIAAARRFSGQSASATQTINAVNRSESNSSTNTNAQTNSRPGGLIDLIA